MALGDGSGGPAAAAGGLGGFLPGFDFLQNLVRNAGSAMPSMGQWVVPTLDPEELERRISDLRTVQFWLDQNSRLLATTIQALEVQRMTLSALKGMNVTVSQMQDALKMKPTPSPAPQPVPEPPAPPEPAPEAAPAASAAAPAAPAGVVDAMQWWGALTQQFSQLAAQAMQGHGAAGSAPSPAGSPAGSPGKPGAPAPAKRASRSTPRR